MNSSLPVSPSTMAETFGPLLRWFTRGLFGQVTYPPYAIATIRQLEGKVALVYLTHSHRMWLGLCLHSLLLRHGLPLPQFVGGIPYRLFQSFGRFVRSLFQPQTVARVSVCGHYGFERELSWREQLLARYTEQGLPVFFALPRRAIFPWWWDRSDYLQALVTMQKQTPQPVAILPHTLVSGGGLPLPSGQLFKLLYHKLLALLSLRRGQMRLAEPLRLDWFIAEHHHLDDHSLAQLLRVELQRRLSQEERVVAGSGNRFDAIRKRIFDTQSVRQAIQLECQKTNDSALSVERRAEKILANLAARFSLTTIRWFDTLLTLFFRVWFDSIDVCPQELERIEQLMRQGQNLVFCPSHRSHVDYLLISYLLWQHGMTPPHIAAGNNLSFFPLGFLFRRAGAFFIKRSFRNNVLYGALLAAYVAELLQSGTCLEVFIEGTRSRNGKLLQPRLGFLHMLVNAWSQHVCQDIQFVPIAIDYDRTMEVQSYTNELHGQSKTKETLWALLNSWRLLRRHYGTIRVRFGEPLSLAAYAQHHRLPRHHPEAAQSQIWRPHVRYLGYNILNRIQKQCSISVMQLCATACLLLPPGFNATLTFLHICDHLLEILQGSRVLLVAEIQSSKRKNASIYNGLRKMAESKLLITIPSLKKMQHSEQYLPNMVMVPDNKRFTLHFFKNAVSAHLSVLALCARAAYLHIHLQKVHRPMPIENAALFLLQLFRYEFIYDSDVLQQGGFTALVKAGFNALRESGYLDVNSDGYHIASDKKILALTTLLDASIDTYYFTLKVLSQLGSEKRFSKRELSNCVLNSIYQAFNTNQCFFPEAAHRFSIEYCLDYCGHAGLVTLSELPQKFQLQSAGLQALAEQLQLLRVNQDHRAAWAIFEK